MQNILFDSEILELLLSNFSINYNNSLTLKYDCSTNNSLSELLFK